MLLIHKRYFVVKNIWKPGANVKSGKNEAKRFAIAKEKEIGRRMPSQKFQNYEFASELFFTSKP